ncbi:hypothetical protein ACTXT7_010935 [Hymenolepis weldensis]
MAVFKVACPNHPFTLLKADFHLAQVKRLGPALGAPPHKQRGAPGAYVDLAYAYDQSNGTVIYKLKTALETARKDPEATSRLDGILVYQYEDEVDDRRKSIILKWPCLNGSLSCDSTLRSWIPHLKSHIRNA